MTQEGKLPMGKKSPKNAVKNYLQLYLAKSEPSSFSSSPQALSLSLSLRVWQLVKPVG